MKEQKVIHFGCVRILKQLVIIMRLGINFMPLEITPLYDISDPYRYENKYGYYANLSPQIT